MTVADLQTRSGVWEGVVTDVTRADANVRLFLTIETDGKASDGTFRIRKAFGQIHGELPNFPQLLDDGYCNLGDVKITGNGLNGPCRGWLPASEPVESDSLQFHATYNKDGSAIVGELSRGTASFPIQLHRLHQDLASVDGTWVADAGDKWGASAGTTAVLHNATAAEGAQNVTADYWDVNHAAWGLQFDLVGQPDHEVVFLIEGRGKGSQFHAKLSADKTKLIGHASGGQFLPNTWIRISDTGTSIPK